MNKFKEISKADYFSTNFKSRFVPDQPLKQYYSRLLNFPWIMKKILANWFLFLQWFWCKLNLLFIYHK